MRLPGFVAHESLYRTSRNYRGGTGAGVCVGEGAVSPQWDFCYDCSPSGLKTCCDGTFPNLLCAQVPCCTPSCSPCTPSLRFWPLTGSFDCIDGRCNTSVHGCQICKHRTPTCSEDCKKGCSPGDQACLDLCDCCCSNITAESFCEYCLNGVWDPDFRGCIRT